MILTSVLAPARWLNLIFGAEMTGKLLKLNLGSGSKRIDGYLNVDFSSECQPDIVMDLEKTPYDFADDSVSHIAMHHVLEHIGQTTETFLNIIKELYRICVNGATIDIIVPHPNHDTFIADPTHVRPITGMTMSLFDRELNLIWRETKAANSPLALQCGVNFKTINVVQMVDSNASRDYEALKAKDPFLADMLVKYGRNIFLETHIVLRAVK